MHRVHKYRPGLSQPHQLGENLKHAITGVEVYMVTCKVKLYNMTLGVMDETRAGWPWVNRGRGAAETRTSRFSARGVTQLLQIYTYRKCEPRDPFISSFCSATEFLLMKNISNRNKIRVQLIQFNMVVNCRMEVYQCVFIYSALVSMETFMRHIPEDGILYSQPLRKPKILYFHAFFATLCWFVFKLYMCV
jgi:hypothetical protein